MRVIDFHCDTPAVLFAHRNNADFCAMAGAESTGSFEFYLQFSAFFCPQNLDDESACAAVFEMLDWWQEKPKNTVKCIKSLKNALFENKAAHLLTIEDARLFAGDLSRVDALFGHGVRLVTPLWRGVSVMGGAWDTDEGLSPFGALAVERFLSLGGLVDLSHASRKSHDEIAALCRRYDRAPLATHSNAFAITPHRRNLTDEQIRGIAERGGVIGLNFYPAFLSQSGKADLGDLCAHLRHVLRAGGAAAAVLGSDFDGVDALPRGISSAADLPRFAEHLNTSGFTAGEIEAFFFENGRRYLLENLP